VTVPARVIVRRDSYHDSVLLMRISRELKLLDGVRDAVVAMGTPHNRQLLAGMGFGGAELDTAGPNDLVIAVETDRITPEECQQKVEALLAGAGPAIQGEAGPQRPQTLAGALAGEPEANLVLISVPGLYAAREARRALARGLHVMLFSDNVAVEDEVALKEEAVGRGLLLMGPDCGTAIIAGLPLAFANVVRRGSIGIVGASGTGIQEVCCCIDRLGGGVSHAIGTGGRDLSDQVDGRMTRFAVQALVADPRTEVLVVVSKPPSATVAAAVVDELKAAGKPAVVQFVGAPPAAEPVAGSQVFFADTLAGAAEIACRLAGLEVPGAGPAAPGPEADPDLVAGLAAELAATAEPGARLCGLFCGGTTAQEAVTLLSRAGLSVSSNLHREGPRRVVGTDSVAGHVVLDLGDDVFTAGRPHPMIEPVLRNERLEREVSGSGAQLLLCDVILGYGSHADPAGVLAAGVSAARQRAAAADGRLVAVASITGTSGDPQGLDGQRRRLEEAGVIVMPDNRLAVQLTAAVLQEVS